MPNIFDQDVLNFSDSEIVSWSVGIYELIKQFGTPIEFYKAFACPCQTKTIRSPRFSCEFCEGLGFQYSEAIPLRVMITRRRVDKKHFIAGELDEGFAWATFPKDVYPAEADRIKVLSETVVVNNSVIIKGDKDHLGNSIERVRFMEILSIEDLRDLKRVYTEGSDFEIMNKRYINWLSDGPDEGDSYSIRYRVNPEYLIWMNEPSVRMPSNVPFPYRCQIRRLDYIDSNRTK